MSTKREEYLFECFRTAREELLMRVRHRDNWLKLQLLAQGALLALSQGVKFAGVESSRELPTLIVLAIPIGLVFMSLYFVEDRLIGVLSRYIGSLSLREAKLSAGPDPIPNWDSSPELRAYGQNTLPIRIFAQVLSFVLIPAGLALFVIKTWNVPVIIVESVAAAVTGGLIFRGYKHRRNVGHTS
jgi:hypothetical protein